MVLNVVKAIEKWCQDSQPDNTKPDNTPPNDTPYNKKATLINEN